jgi:hypothetical protein
MHVFNQQIFFFKQLFLNDVKAKQFDDNDKNLDANKNDCEMLNQFLVLK